MTNTEIIQSIRNEIERLKTIQLKRIQEGDLVDAEPYDKNEAYNELLDFIDSIESEKPMNQEGLEEEISRYLREECSGDDEPSISEIARHFAEWGAEHLADARKTSPNDLEEAAEEYIKKGKYLPEAFVVRPAFIAGAKWQAEQLLKSSPMPEDTVLFNKGVEEGKRLAKEEQADLFTIVALDAAQRAKEQMMKEAVEYEVWDFSVEAYPHVNIPLDNKHYRNGDKVRVIVLPKED